VKEKIQDSTDKGKEKRKETRSAIQQFNSLGERGKLGFDDLADSRKHNDVDRPFPLLRQLHSNIRLMAPVGFTSTLDPPIQIQANMQIARLYQPRSKGKLHSPNS
jgi:hypothetical protein